jgi:hypothetical protein
MASSSPAISRRRSDERVEAAADETKWSASSDRYRDRMGPETVTPHLSGSMGVR